MATQLLQGGKPIQWVSLDEYEALLERRERARARGIKMFEYAVPLGTATGGAANPANYVTVGPAEGYTWSVRVVSSTLSAAGTLTAYKCSDSAAGSQAAGAQTTRLVGYNGTSQTPQVMQFPSDTLMLQHGTALYLVASTGLTNYYLAGWEAIAEQQWKLMD